jgi:hypothetical protein
MNLKELDMWTQSIQAIEDLETKEVLMRAHLKISARIKNNIPATVADEQFHFLTFAECSMPNSDRDNNEEQ